MGWWDSHLHAFDINDKRYVMSGLDQWDDFPDDIVEDRIKIAKLVSVGDTFVYQYDFGDNWEHLVEVEAITPVDVALTHATCVGGARSCPPEDVGSTHGYEQFLSVLADPTDEEHEHYMEWSGGHFDAESFDLSDVNARLQRVR